MSTNSSTSSSSAKLRRYERIHTRFQAKVGLLIASILLCIGGFNAWVDPLGRLGTNTLGLYHSAEFEYKVNNLRTAQFDGILVGSSKIGNIDPRWFDSHRLFNAAFSGAMPEEMDSLLRVNTQSLVGKFVIVGLDFFMFNTHNPATRLAAKSAAPGHAALAYVFSLRATYFALQTLIKSATGQIARLQANGARNIQDLIAEDARLSGPDYGEKIEAILGSLYTEYEFSELTCPALETTQDGSTALRHQSSDRFKPAERNAAQADLCPTTGPSF